MKKGILYCATDEEYYKQAKLSAQSVKKTSMDIPCAICTSMKIKDDSLWNEVIYIVNSNVDYDQYVIDKIRALLLTPFNYTLYLDADTFVLDNTTELFKILNKFDIAICHGHNRLRRYNIQHGIISHRGKKRKVISDSIPYAFATLQSGLILYKKNDKIDKLLNELLALYKKKLFYDDQAIIRELLWESDIKFYILPPEYNFNSIKDYKHWKRNEHIAKPKIFHYTKHKTRNIERLIQNADRKYKVYSLIKRLFKWQIM